MKPRKRNHASRQKRRRSDEAAFSHRGQSTATPAALVVNGWTLYRWRGFQERWDALQTRVERLRAQDPDGYRSHPDAVMFAAVYKLVTEVIPRDPGHSQFRQGHTMGDTYVHWRRAKFLRRFRLFFRYHSPSKSIVYAWLNDENTLRKAGAKSDVYLTFKRLLENGVPPTDWDKLLTESEQFSSHA